ncbi:Glutamyl-tRNA amidotransferase [Salix suchowensis]|nr:Glutamyl-tRNA amidotransferase [Salix suchowensis]
MGLMEIVSEPDMRSPEEAALYVRSLQSLLRAVGASDGNMEQVSAANLSFGNTQRHSFQGLSKVRCECVRQPPWFAPSEIRRHIDILDSSSSVPQETRGFSEQTFETFKLRSKGDAPDYRYMPDMNLEAVFPTSTDVEILLALDAEKDIPFDGETAVPSSAGAVRYFENICQDRGQGAKEKPRDPKVVLNWYADYLPVWAQVSERMQRIIHELVGQLSARRETFTAQRVPSSWLAELIDMVQGNIITRTSGKSLLRHTLHNPSVESPKQLAHKLDLIALRTDDQVSSAGTASPAGDMDLAAICRASISQMPAEVVAYQAGNVNVLNKIVGHVMKTTRGRANALAVKAVLQAMLDGN